MIPSSKGFTLVELLVVIAIIGILAGIIMASLSTARAKGRDAKRVSDIKQIQLALELYYDACGNYPYQIYTVATNINFCNGVSISTGLVGGGYIPNVPYDPNATVPCTTDDQPGCYTYTSYCSASGVVTGYHLGAALESSNAALSSDADFPKAAPSAVCSGNAQGVDFSGTSYTAGGSLCNGVAGNPYPNGSNQETCFDAIP